MLGFSVPLPGGGESANYDQLIRALKSEWYIFL
jgi:hypothetical protein